METTTQLYTWLNSVEDKKYLEDDGSFIWIVYSFIKDRTDITDEEKHSIIYWKRNDGTEHISKDFDEIVSYDWDNAEMGDGQNGICTRSSSNGRVTIGVDAYYSSWNWTEMNNDVGIVQWTERIVKVPTLTR